MALYPHAPSSGPNEAMLPNSMILPPCSCFIGSSEYFRIVKALIRLASTISVSSSRVRKGTGLLTPSPTVLMTVWMWFATRYFWYCSPATSSLRSQTSEPLTGGNELESSLTLTSERPNTKTEVFGLTVSFSRTDLPIPLPLPDVAPQIPIASIYRTSPLWRAPLSSKTDT